MQFCSKHLIFQQSIEFHQQASRAEILINTSFTFSQVLGVTIMFFHKLLYLLIFDVVKRGLVESQHSMLTLLLISLNQNLFQRGLVLKDQLTFIDTWIGIAKE